jgi:hypothetical protein
MYESSQQQQSPT